MKKENRTIKLPEIEIAGVGEKSQYLVHEMNDNTIRFALRYPCRLSAELMERAVYAVINGIDVLHSSFKQGGMEAYWVLCTEFSKEDYFSVTETEDDPMVPAKSALLKSVVPDGKVQMYCTLIRGSRESVLVLSISHLCVDGGDGRYLLEKVVESYNLLVSEGSTDRLVLKNGSRSAFQVYRELDKKEYMSAVKPSLPGVKTIFPFPEEDEGHANLVRYTIDAASVRKARNYGKARNATINDLILTACYRAYVKLPGTDAQQALSIMSMMDLRRHCTDGTSDGLCNMSGTLPTVLEQGVQGTFEDTLEEIAAQTRKAKEDPVAGLNGLPLVHTLVKVLPLWLLLKVADKIYGSMSIGLTNLGNLSGSALSLAGVSPIEAAFAGPLKKKPGMQISAVGLDGAVTLSCIGEYGDIDAERIGEMLQNIAEELKQLEE